MCVKVPVLQGTTSCCAAPGTSTINQSKGLVPLFRRDLVEHAVVDHQRAQFGKAGDVAITVIPANILVVIELARIKVLRRIVVDAADIERQSRVSRREVSRVTRYSGLVSSMTWNIDHDSMNIGCSLRCSDSS